MSEASMTPSNPASDRNEAAERLRDRLPPWKGLHEEFDAALATERAIGAALDEDRLAFTQDDFADTICFLDGHDKPSDRSACSGCREFAESAFGAFRARLTPQPGGQE